MSYCRPGDDSDVYVIASRIPRINRSILQCYCTPARSFLSRSRVIAHLIQHLKDGEMVPDRAFLRLLREIREQGDEL